MFHEIKVAAIQMVSHTDVAINIATMRHLVRQAAADGAQWIVLPEYWPIMGRHDSDKYTIAETLGSGSLQDAMCQIAAECQIVLFGGSIPLKSPVANKVLNSLLVYGRDGKLLNQYDKMHLFGFQRDGERYAESDSIVSGNLVPHFAYDGWNVAQGICYDLRFPEFFRAQKPFEIMVLPAAFTHTTGQAHWHLLLRARAVENQCYVIAAAQGGKHENERRTYGHSLIINPWGDIIAELSEGEGHVCATLSRTELNAIRTQLPALQHRQL